MKNKDSSTIPLVFIILGLPAFIILKPFIADLDIVKNFNVDSKALWSLDVSTLEIDAVSSTVRAKITNDGIYGFKDLKVECDATGESGTVIQSIDYTFYKLFDGSGEYYETFDLENIPDQTHSLKCKATDLEVVSREACMVSIDESGNAVRSNCKQVEL